MGKTKIIRNTVRFKRLLREYGLAILAGIGLLAFTLISGWYSPVILFGFFFFKFVTWAHKNDKSKVIGLAMIASIATMINALEVWQNQAEEKVIDEVKPVESQVIALNANDQLFIRGIDNTGSAIQPPYSPKTVSMKVVLGQPTNRVTLRDTGDFHDSFFIEYEKDEFSIVADDPKTGKLQSKYGNEILGLTDASIDQVVKMVRLGVISSFRKTVLG